MRKTLLLATAVLGCFATIASAQLTNNPYAVNVTNTTALAAINNGFGVAILGYPMPTPGTNFFSDTLDGIAVGDASTSGGNQVFYIANEDNFIGGGIYAFNLVGHSVQQSLANPNQFTVARSFVASVQTNAPDGPDGGYGSGCAGTIGVGGVSKNGTIVFRMDGFTSPGSPGMAGEAVITLPAWTPSTTIITNAVENIANGGLTLAITVSTQDLPQMGQNNNLVIKNTFDGLTYAARPDIFNWSPGLSNEVALSLPSPLNGTNNQVLVGSGPVPGTFATFATWNTRGMMVVNDTAKILAGYVKTAADNTTGGDSMTGIAVLNYTDAGGAITVTSLQTNIFGSTATGNWVTGGTSGITTNGQYFFSRTGANGPAQISINDSGAVAFAVSINIDAANNATNGTRAAIITGILCKPAGSSTFLKVVDNTDPTLFWQAPGSCTNKNFISDVAIDNYNNVYFEAAYTNNTNFACDLFPSNAVYEAVANDPINPTSWTTRILLKQGDTFVNPTTGDTNLVYALPYNAGPATRTVSQRSFGPNAINRTQLPGHANTLPSDPFAVGGIVVQATITNLTKAFRSDALLYVAPYTAAACPFRITSITRSGNDINLTWLGLAGNNVVQATNGGNYTNNFTDVATVTLSSCGLANYTDVGGAPAGSTNRYYRIKVTQ